MADGLSAISNLFEALIEDVEQLVRTSALEEQARRRSYVRAVFALIEGVSHAMKVAASGARLATATFDRGEIALLAGEEYALDEQGRAVTRAARLRTLPNTRFAFAALARAYGADFVLDCSGPAWESFRLALRIRHRLMHPKSENDLSVSDEELQAVSATFRWFVASIALCLAKSAQRASGSLRTISPDHPAVLTPADQQRIAAITARYQPHAR